MPGFRTGVPRATRRSRARKRSGAYRSSPTISITYLIDAAAALKRRIDATP